MDKEMQFLLHRFKDLDQQAYYRNITTFSDFLTLNERSTLQENLEDYYCHISFFGGYDLSERQIAIFQSDAPFFYENVPISCIEIKPLSKKYAEKLTHRDVLGAFMHSGIERDQIGDILIISDIIYVFCTEKISAYIMQEISRIKHTSVMTRIVPMQDFDYQPEFKEVTTTISSNRLDTFTAAACNMSRGQTAEYIRSDQVFINGRLCNDVNHRLNDGDVISFRGKGKVVFDGVLGNTKKEKLRIRYRWYQ